ncbi:MAG: hypothetical protein ACTMIR_09465 [Cellulomonadaceae bacterium]
MLVAVLSAGTGCGGDEPDASDGSVMFPGPGDDTGTLTIYSDGMALAESTMVMSGTTPESGPKGPP